jgi:hypothetical protein
MLANKDSHAQRIWIHAPHHANQTLKTYLKLNLVLQSHPVNMLANKDSHAKKIWVRALHHANQSRKTYLKHNHVQLLLHVHMPAQVDLLV